MSSRDHDSRSCWWKALAGAPQLVRVHIGKTHCRAHQDPSKRVPMFVGTPEANVKMVPIYRVPIPPCRTVHTHMLACACAYKHTQDTAELLQIPWNYIHCLRSKRVRLPILRKLSSVPSVNRVKTRSGCACARAMCAHCGWWRSSSHRRCPSAWA